MLLQTFVLEIIYIIFFYEKAFLFNNVKFSHDAFNGSSSPV